MKRRSSVWLPGELRGGFLTRPSRRVGGFLGPRLKSAVPLVDQVAEHIISGGGKRLRPLLVVLTARACGHQGASHIEAAAFIEFIHTATLLHDDVVDRKSVV